MASGKRKRSYSRQDVLDLILNDSDSEGPNVDYDSDISNEDSESDVSEVTVSERSETPQSMVEGSGASSESDSSSDGDEAMHARGRGRPAARRGRGHRAARRGRGATVRGRGATARVHGVVRGMRGARPQQRNQRPEVPARQEDLNPDQPPENQGMDGQGDFHWERYDFMDPYAPEWLPEFTAPRGVLVDTEGYKPVDYFMLFFPDEAFDIISLETNRYATQFFDNPADLPRFSRFHKWEDTSANEIKAYIALQIAMGLCQKNELEDYWSTFWLTWLPFTEIMPRNRYELITAFIHFTNNEQERPARGEPGYDHLWKVRPLIEICEDKYTTVYAPRCELSIDESIFRYKGRVSFRQYMPSKPYRWGIKQFALCESKTGYALKFMTYFGKGTVTQVPGFSITESLCIDLLRGFENKGHKVFTDNYYSSPVLFRELQNRQIGACGTVKPGRKHLPMNIHPSQLPLVKGDDPYFMRAGDVTTCAWHDTKRVHFLSTIDTNNTVDKRIRQRGIEGGYRTVEKPVVAEIYNQSMGGVDMLDQKLCTFAYPHKSSKWYSVVYHRLREVALVKAYIAYCDTNQERMSQRVFRENVITGLLEGWKNPAARRGRPSSGEQEARLTERHFVGEFEDKKFRPDCVVCSARNKQGWKRKQTSYNCKQCNVAMCPVPCHELYHTYKNYRQEAARRVHNL